MAYETGSFADLTNGMEKIRDFCVNKAGWTLNDYSDDADWGGKRLHVQKGTNYANIVSLTAMSPFGVSITGIVLNSSTSYVSGDQSINQPGVTMNESGTKDAALSGMTQAISYQFFSNDDNLAFVFEVLAGKYNFITFGKTSKGNDVVSGTHKGSYYYSNYVASFGNDYYTTNATFVKSSAWHNGGDIALSGFGAIGSLIQYTSFNEYLIKSQPNDFNGLSLLLTNHIFLKDSGVYHPLGDVGYVKILDTRYYEPGQDVIVGSNTYTVFPIYYKPTTSLGYAVLKVV